MRAIYTFVIFRFSTFWNATFSAWSWYRLVNSGTRCGEPCAWVPQQPGDWDGLLGTGNQSLSDTFTKLLFYSRSRTDVDEQAWFLPCLMQGNTQEELPEFLLGTCRLNYLDASKAVSLDECWPLNSRSRRRQLDPNSLSKPEYSTNKTKATSRVRAAHKSVGDLPQQCTFISPPAERRCCGVMIDDGSLYYCDAKPLLPFFGRQLVISFIM